MNNTEHNENRPVIRTEEELRGFLNGIRELDRHIELLRDRSRRYEDDVTRITALYGGEAVMRSRNVHAMEDLIAAKVDNDRRINEMVDAFVDRKRYARELIELSGNPDYEQTLSLHYLEYLSWTDISRRMHCAKSTATNRHSEGLNAIIRFLTSEISYSFGQN